ncbi:baseplate J/gp47 family protein [Salmonella enterica]
MFQLKNFVSIAASMLNYVRSTTGLITDLQPGSVTRTILESPAAEIEELYIQVFNGIREAIPVAVYNSIDFDKLPPKYAAGQVTVITNVPLTQNLLVPAGTRFLGGDGRIYVTGRDATWNAKDSNGQNITSVEFSVVAQNPGYIQNAASGDINSSPFFNPDQFTIIGGEITGGADEETDDARKIRFASYIQALSRGTKEALAYGAMSAYLTDANGNITESVTRASVDETSGHVVVYVWGSQGAPSKQLLSRVTQIETGYVNADNQPVPGFTAAGIRTEILAFDTTNVDASYRLQMQTGVTQTPAIEQAVQIALSSYLSNVSSGTTIYVDDLRNAAMTVRGVANADLIGLVGNISIPKNEIPQLGSITFATTPLNANFELTFKAGFTPNDSFVDDATEVIRQYLTALPTGTVITSSHLVAAMMTMTNVEKVKVSDITMNITLSAWSLLTLGKLNFNLPTPAPAPQEANHA